MSEEIKICVVTGSRAEYGLLYWLMKGIQSDPECTLQLIVTGMHLSPEFGLTYKEIEADGFNIDKKIEMTMSSDTPGALSKSVGIGVISFSDALASLSPDLLILLGDRSEIFSAAIAALFGRFPIAHFHGGEATEGVVDEAIRHSITKIAQYHFVANCRYRKRVIQLGEDPGRVFVVGGMGVDFIKKLKVKTKTELKEELSVPFQQSTVIVTFHSVTLEKTTAREQFLNILLALDELPNTYVIFTKTNSDTEGRVINELIDSYVRKNQARAKSFNSLGQVNYISLLTHADGVVGNSSSGLLEAPSCGTGTINVGDRQRGRDQGPSVIQCTPDLRSLREAFRQLFDEEFQSRIRESKNSYGDGGASDLSLKIIKQIDLDQDNKKIFFDI